MYIVVFYVQHSCKLLQRSRICCPAQPVSVRDRPSQREQPVWRHTMDKTGFVLVRAITRFIEGPLQVALVQQHYAVTQCVRCSY